MGEGVSFFTRSSSLLARVWVQWLEQEQPFQSTRQCANWSQSIKTQDAGSLEAVGHLDR